MFSLLVASVCGAVCALLAGAGFEKYVKYIAALVCVCIMISPFKSIFKEGLDELVPEISSDGLENGEDGAYIAEQMTEERAEEYVCELVFGKFGIKEVSADIVIDWSGQDGVISSITVAVPKEEAGRLGEISDYLVYSLGGEVNVVEA